MRRKAFCAVLVLLSLLGIGCSDSEEKNKKDKHNTLFEGLIKKAPREPLPKPGHVLK